jgi:hypothetical protein
MNQFKKDKEKMANLSPRMNEHKARKVVHKIVDMQIYRTKDTTDEVDENFKKIDSKVKQGLCRKKVKRT